MHFNAFQCILLPTSNVKTQEICIKYILIKQWRKAESFSLFETYDYLH